MIGYPRLCTISAGVLGGLFLIAAPQAQAITMDFDTDAMGNPIRKGQIIDNEYANWGVNIEVDNPNKNFDIGTAFDSLNYSGGDNDLRTDSRRYGRNNNVERGNLLIIAERNERTRDGRIRHPDDEAGGGSITFSMDRVYNGGSMAYVDTDENRNYVSFFLANVPVYTHYFRNMGDNGVDEYLFDGFDFDKIVVNMHASGGLDAVTLSAIPEPVTTSLAAMGLVAVSMSVMRRRGAEAS